jgi:hypothetical protein
MMRKTLTTSTCVALVCLLAGRGSAQDPDFGGDFAPVIDEGSAFGGDFAPVVEEGSAYGGDFAPVVEEEPSYGGDFAPVVDDEPEEPVDEAVEPEEDDAYWDQYWEQLEAEPAAETVVEEGSGGIPAGQGRVVGVVIDDEFGQPVYGTEITVENTEITTTTAGDGRFSILLDPGAWVVHFANFSYAPAGYQVTVDDGIEVDMGQIRLITDAARTMTIVVEARADQASEATQLLERREATVVSDAVSAEQISRAPDSSAGDSARRVVGVTIVDDRFLFVRGLGGRYTSVTLNGVPVPRTDPTYPGVELDIFPADLLSSITLYKAYSADLAGGFTGGLMDIQTRTYPETFSLKLGLSLSGDTETTFRGDILDYSGGSLDGLGFDDGGRAMPGSVPRDARVQPVNLLGDGLAAEDIERIAESFEPNWSLTDSFGRPNFSLKGTVGDTLELGERRLGYLLALNYGNTVERRISTIRNVDVDLQPREVLTRDRGTEKVLWGALANLSLNIADGHDISLMSLWNQSALDRAELVSGMYEEEGAYGERSQLAFVSRSLSFTQLLGSHRRLLPSASPWHEMSVSYSAALAAAMRDEPDTRYLLRLSVPELDTLRWRPNPGSGERFYSELEQRDYSGSFKFELPYLDLFEAEAGASTLHGTRDFSSRRFRYTASGSSDPTIRDLPADEIFTAENIAPTGIWFADVAQPSDFYASDEHVWAGYGMLEYAPIEWMRIIGGLRYESYLRRLERGSEVAPAPESDELVRRVETDFLPSAGLVFTLNDDESMFVRANYGGTVARPQVNEFAPFVTQDYVRRRTIAGNPDLLRTYVHNADLRWEWFPGATEVLAVSAFAKEFLHPIERVVADQQGSVVRFENALGATNYGGELEARVSLGRITDALSDVVVQTNVTVVESNIELECTPREDDPSLCLEPYTSQERPMAGQSPWVINGAIGYENEDADLQLWLLYNVFGKRIEDVGRLGRPDEYLLPVHQLDFTAAWGFAPEWAIKFAAKNIALQDERNDVGGVVVERTTRPLGLSLSMSWEPTANDDESDEVVESNVLIEPVPSSQE